MNSNYGTWYHSYKPAKKYTKKVAYFSMEFGVHQGLKIYSGGLGFLAGSHMRSGYDLKQNMIGIGMLWKYGYYDQARNEDRTLLANYIEKNYSFLEDSGIEVTVRIMDNPSVKVRAMVLKPETFGTVPLYLLTTDLEENDHLSRTITHHLYDSHEHTRIAQSIVLGIGGTKVVEALGGADIYHLNEGHALPAFYYLSEQGIKKEQMAFTTHTPEKAGNEEHHGPLLNEFGFFGRHLTPDELERETVDNGNISYTVSALRMSKKSNAVSKLHARVANDMWKEFEGISEIIPITNAQHQGFWQDKALLRALEKTNPGLYRKRKRELKTELFLEVLNQTGKLMDPDVLTIVWARRFAEYKRPDLLLYDLQRFEKLIEDKKYPIQIIWAGKPYPKDTGAIEVFNRLIDYARGKSNLAVMIGYEIELSRKLKCGSDIWLNNPRITREASGTSGMTAAMNGSVNVSVNDGWIPEFQKNGENCFVLPEVDHRLPVKDQDRKDSTNLYQLLEDVVIPMYYDRQEDWQKIAFGSMSDVVPEFTSRRMASEYYENLY